MKKTLSILAIGIVMLLSSCEPVEGCGNVVGGDVRDNGTYYLVVDFGNKTKRVTVDLNTFLSYPNGSYICF